MLEVRKEVTKMQNCDTGLGESTSEYFIICPRCKRKADAVLKGNNFKAVCKCGASYSGTLEKEPLSPEEAMKAMEKLKEVRKCRTETP